MEIELLMFMQSKIDKDNLDVHRRINWLLSKCYLKNSRLVQFDANLQNSMFINNWAEFYLEKFKQLEISILNKDQLGDDYYEKYPFIFIEEVMD